MRKNILFILLLITFSACKKGINYNFNYDGDKLALYGYVSDEEGIWVDLYRSFSPFDTVRYADNVFVENAIISLFEDDIYIGKLDKIETKGRYKLNNYIPKQGKYYHFEASAEGYEDIYSDKVILSTPFTLHPVGYYTDSIARETLFGTDTYDFYAIINYSFEDLESGEKYYMLEFEAYFQDTLLDRFNQGAVFIDYENTTTSCNFGDTWFNNSCLGENNIEIKQGIKLERRVTNQDLSEKRIADKLILKTRKINKVWYDRLSTEQSFQGEWTDSFGEPLLYKTNIHGGFGWVSAFSSHTTEIEL